MPNLVKTESLLQYAWIAKISLLGNDLGEIDYNTFSRAGRRVVSEKRDGGSNFNNRSDGADFLEEGVTEDGNNTGGVVDEGQQQVNEILCSDWWLINF